MAVLEYRIILRDISNKMNFVEEFPLVWGVHCMSQYGKGYNLHAAMQLIQSPWDSTWQFSDEGLYDQLIQRVM